MKFATLEDGSLDGRMIIVSRDLTRCVSAGAIASNLAEALRNWNAVEARLKAAYDGLNSGDADDIHAFDPGRCLAPLPRSPQWCDASAFLNHGRLMDQAFNATPIPDFDTVPVMYQGASDDFLGAAVDVSFQTEADGIDFEGEFGVIVGDVPMAVRPDEALRCIRLLVQINDWSLRTIGAREYKTGFGFLQAKPSTAFAPVAITPDELGSDWEAGRVLLNLYVELNGIRFGDANGGEMHYDFGQLIAHAARTRRLTAGTIIGSGTVSNLSRNAGSSCIAERRVIEIIDQGSASTSFMKFGDRVRMEARRSGTGGGGPFGMIDQAVVAMAGRA